MNTLLGILLLGVTLKGAEGDISCYLEKLSESVFVDAVVSGRMCRNPTVRDVFQNLRQDLEECNVTLITLNGVEKYLVEFCDRNSERFAVISASAECYGNFLDCLPRINPEDFVLERIQRKCTNKDSFFTCVSNSWEPCGPRASRLSRRFTETFRPFVEELCAQAGACDDIISASAPVLSYSTFVQHIFLTSFLLLYG